jgi:hypothetical protein
VHPAGIEAPVLTYVAYPFQVSNSLVTDLLYIATVADLLFISLEVHLFISLIANLLYIATVADLLFI